jgi:hypothetical protein
MNVAMICMKLPAVIAHLLSASCSLLKRNKTFRSKWQGLCGILICCLIVFSCIYKYICCHSCPSINAIGPTPLRGGLKNINRSAMLICIANAPSLLQNSYCLGHKCMLIIPQITRNKSSHLLFVKRQIQTLLQF